MYTLDVSKHARNTRHVKLINDQLLWKKYKKGKKKVSRIDQGVSRWPPCLCMNGVSLLPLCRLLFLLGFRYLDRRMDKVRKIREIRRRVCTITQKIPKWYPKEFLSPIAIQLPSGERKGKIKKRVQNTPVSYIDLKRTCSKTQPQFHITWPFSSWVTTGFAEYVDPHSSSRRNCWRKWHVAVMRVSAGLSLAGPHLTARPWSVATKFWWYFHFIYIYFEFICSVVLSIWLSVHVFSFFVCISVFLLLHCWSPSPSPSLSSPPSSFPVTPLLPISLSLNQSLILLLIPPLTGTKRIIADPSSGRK